MRHVSATAGGVYLWLGGAACTALLAALAFGRRESVTSAVVIDRAASGTTGSGACRSCHPGEYASWHRSFHRTMTQVATATTALGPWKGVRVEADGRSIELSQRGDELWLRLPDPDVVAAAVRAGVANPSGGAPLVSRRAVLSTGSHHQQTYWVEGGHGELRLAPITYLVAERRYVARHDAFLQPPDAPLHALRWNSNCIQCHATRGEPRLDEHTDTFASSAVELGIACEACHGPGAEHAAKYRTPFLRLFAHLAQPADPGIVNPARLPPARASEVCGQCHAYFVPRDEDRFWKQGYAYRPGDPLNQTRALLDPTAPSSGLIEASTESLFWRDGTIRVGGRELNGLERSACFLRGSGDRKISCLSCHSLHDSEPNDQLRHGASLDAACEHCHEHEAARRAEHTHHAGGSAGSSCVNCHMPFTSYALYTAIRSHRIDEPSALATATTGRPNACNLCHLDRTLGWTAERLHAWYGRPEPQSAASFDAKARAGLDSGTARAIEELLAGDAATRVVVAAAFGREDALAASGADWEARLLVELLDDPYAAVRNVAGSSLRALRGFTDFHYDFVASSDSRRAARAAALERATASPVRRSDRALLLDSHGPRDEARILELLGARDQHPITISE